MKTDTTNLNAGEMTDTLHQGAEALRETIAAGGNLAKDQGQQMLACASERIRGNPIPSVLVAFGAGIAVGCLIVSSRNTFADDVEDFTAAPRDLASHIGESITDSLGRLYSNLKFW